MYYDGARLTGLTHTPGLRVSRVLCTSNSQGMKTTKFVCYAEARLDVADACFI